MLHGLREKKVSFNAYYGFVIRGVHVKVNLEYFSMMPFMGICGHEIFCIMFTSYIVM